MITDRQTNSLYLADTLPEFYPDFYQRFQKELVCRNVKYALLPKTKDVWAVDYMPIQIDIDKFARFTYNPAYLQTKKYLNTISDVDAICEQIGLFAHKTKIVLDGGNVTRWTNKIIMTDRVFVDNLFINGSNL